MKLTTSEQSAILVRVAKSMGITVPEMTRKIKSGSDEKTVERFISMVERENAALEATKSYTRGNNAYVEMRKTLRELMKKPTPALIFEKDGGRPQNFSEVFKNGRVRNAFEAISIYTASDKHSGPAISARHAELNFLNQDTLLVKKARDYVRGIGLSIK